MEKIRAAAGAGLLVAALAACSSSSATTAAAPGTTATATGATGASQSAKPSGTLVVFAATSLTAAFDKIGAQFQQANPGVSVKFNYNGSSSLATQITQAAPTDVFASASPTNMKTVTDQNLASTTPKDFASNSGEIMVEAGNPSHINSVANLASSSVKVVTCAPEVPCGALATSIFKNADVTVRART